MSTKSRTEYSILNIVTGLGGYAINTILGFICRIVFIKYLTSEYLGINGLFSNILSMLSLAELGVGSAIVYALYKPLAENDKKKISALMHFYGKAYRIIGIVVAIFGLMMIPFLNIAIKNPPNIKENLYIIYILFLFNTSSSYFFSYRSSLLMANQQTYIVTGINYIVTILQSVFQMMFLFLTGEYMVYLIIQTMGTFIFNMIVSYIAKKKFPYIDENKDIRLNKDEKKDLTKDIKALTIWKLSGLLVNNTDNIIITYFSGLSTVGVSSNYSLLSGTLNSILNQLFNGISASIGNHNASESGERKIELFNTINLINFWLFGWGSIGIICVSNDIVKLCFGSSYLLPLNIPLVMALNFYMVGMQNAVWIYKNTMGIFTQGRYLLLVTAALNLFFSIYLGNKWGLFGILLATSISRALTNTWYDPYAVFKYGFKRSSKLYFRKYFKYIYILILTTIISLFLCSFIDISLFMNVIIKMIICSIITNFIFILFFYNQDEFRYILNILSRIKDICLNKIKIKGEY